MKSATSRRIEEDLREKDEILGAIERRYAEIRGVHVELGLNSSEQRYKSSIRRESQSALFAQANQIVSVVASLLIGSLKNDFVIVVDRPDGRSPIEWNSLGP